MNYFPFHLGDYAAHTAHLEVLEDLAYRRMLDAYYLREGPLPCDVKEVARIIRMKKNVCEVEAVLTEFFTLTENGWVQDRCDLEITKMQEKQESLSEKDQHEKDRMQRYRERRSVMFTALRAKEIVPAWDISMKELQRLFDANCNGPATDLKRNSSIAGNADATAIPTPTPTPTPNKKNSPDLLSESEPVSEFSIPLVDGTDFRVSERLVSEWRAAYPAVDVPQELREMRTWAMANRTKRKTRNGVERFAVAWLGKAQDTPSRAAGNRAAGPDWTAGAT